MKLSSKLIPEGSELPPLYANEEVKDPIAHIHWIAPKHRWEWLILERCSEKGDLLFGYAKSPFTRGGWEMGYLSLSEVEGVGVARRNEDFEPTPVSQLM